MKLSVDEIELDLSLIVEIPEPTHHRRNLLQLLIHITMMSGGLINGLIKLELPVSILFDILSERELMTDRNGEITIVFYHFRHIVGKAVVRIDLLTHKTSFLEVTVEHVPHVLFSHLCLFAHYCTSKIYI